MTISIADKLTEVRKRRGLNVSQLAKQSGLPRSTIYAIEGAEYKSVRTSTLERLAEALKVEVAELMRAPRTKAPAR